MSSSDQCKELPIFVKFIPPYGMACLMCMSRDMFTLESLTKAASGIIDAEDAEMVLADFNDILVDATFVQAFLSGPLAFTRVGKTGTPNLYLQIILTRKLE